MTITIHIPSIVVGFLIGYMFLAVVFAVSFFKSGGAWDIGFSQGWKAGRKFAEDKRKEETE